MKPAYWMGLVSIVLASVVARAVQVDDAPAAPKDAQWTLVCKTFTGPAHMLEAKRAKEQWTRASKLNGFYVVHQEAESTLYYGYYRAYNDQNDVAESKRAQADRSKVEKLTDAGGQRPFANAIFVALASPDPAAPPEWNLANAAGFWSLQIAAYKDSPERKQAAVDSVRAAREQGIEAYYFHGETTSSVCIGCWPREAVKEQDSAVAESSDPRQPILVAAQPLPKGMGQNLMNKEGERIKTLTPRIEPLDPTMIAAMKQYPHHQLNGLEVIRRSKDRNTGKPVDVREPSFLVLIPNSGPKTAPDQPVHAQGTSHPGTSGVPESVQSSAVQPPSGQQQQQQPAQQPPPPRKTTKGTGKLRSLE